MRQGSGMICCFSLKNTSHPEYTFNTDSGVMCLDFHQHHHSLLAVGCYDGTVLVFDVRNKVNRPIYSSSIRTGKHTDPVWQVRELCNGHVVCLGGYCSILLLSYSTSSGALESPDLLLSYITITLASHNTIILIKPIFLSFNPEINYQLTQVHWQEEDLAKELNFFSISSDGQVASWVMSKNELKMEPVMQLKLVTSARDDPG